MIYAFRTSTYVRSIYLYGTERFTARDGYNGIDPQYIPYVKDYAAKNYTKAQIDNALIQGWINQQEYDETIALIPVQ
jgi:hypothetical protein